MHVQPRECGKDVHEFVRFAAVAEGENHVAVAHNAEVAVESVERVEHHSGSAGARECGGDFFADVSAFSNAHDDDLAVFVGCGADGFDGVGESFIESLADTTNLCEFDFEDAAGADEVVAG